MKFSNPPSPHDFSSFEKYKEMLEVREKFSENVEVVDRIMSSGKSSEEIDAAMAAIGYLKHDDAPCGQPWCIERYGCIAMGLCHAQELLEEYFWEAVTHSEDRLLTELDCERCGEKGCHALPLEWRTEGNRKHRTLHWFLELVDALTWNRRTLNYETMAADPIIAALFREAYRFTLDLLHDRPMRSRRKGLWLIEHFLADNDLLDLDESQKLLDGFCTLRKIKTPPSPPQTSPC